jgi:VWFA-related protein
MRKGLLSLMAGVTLFAQEPVFRTQTHEVIVPVSVMSKDGKVVEGLNADDFQVLNDGKPQAVRMVQRDANPLPIHAVIVLEIDDGSGAALAKIKKTASVVSGYITNDMDTPEPSLAAIVTVADEVKLVQNFTPDPNVLGDTFAKLSASGDSARLVDGVGLACDLLAAQSPAARRVIVLISGSRDEDSKTPFADVVVKAQKNDIAIYTISYSAVATAFTQKASDIPPPPPQPGLYDPNNHGGINLLAIPMLLAQLAKQNVAEAFAQSTGGSHQKFTTLHGLESRLTELGTDVHTRYVLAFALPTSQQPGYHQLSVTVREPKDRRVHARTGYWSAKD